MSKVIISLISTFPDLHPRSVGDRSSAAHGAAQHPNIVHADGAAGSHNVSQNHRVRAEHTSEVDREAGELLFVFIVFFCLLSKNCNLGVSLGW